MKKHCLLLLGAVIASTSVATTVHVSSEPDGRFLADSGGLALPDGSLVMVGTFDNAAAITNTSFDALALAAGWNLFGSTVTTDIFGNPGKIADYVVDNSAAADAFAGKQIFLWVFNAPIVGAATEFGIFSASDGNWVYPENKGTNLVSITLQNPNLISYFGNVGAGALHLTTIVPEPAAYALISAVGLLGFVAVRRRRCLTR